MVKIIKTAFTKVKYIGDDPQLTLLSLPSTPVDSHLTSPVKLLFQLKLKTRLPIQPSSTDPHADEHHEHLEDKTDYDKMTQNQMHVLYYHCLLDRQYPYWTPPEEYDSRDSDALQLQHRPHLVHTTAGAVYCQTQKHLQDRVVMKPDPVAPLATDTSDVSNKAQTHVHVPQKPFIQNAPAATLPNLAAHQCNTPTAQQHNPAKQAAAVNAQCNQNAVQSTTELMVPGTPQCASHQGSY